MLKGEKMKKIALLLGAVFGITAAAMADNLVKNGEFKELDKKGVPAGWTISMAKTGNFKAVTSGAPDGGSVTFNLPEQGNFVFRQVMTKVLQPGTKYKVSFKIRGKNFKAVTLGMVFINEGWTKSNGNKRLKVTEEWKEYEEVYSTPDYKQLTGLAFYANKATGTVEICDVEVEPVKED